MAITSETSTEDSRAPMWWLPALNPYSVITVLFIVSLLIAPLMHFPFDVESCWLPWSRASQGKFPWQIYATRSDCNYPPFILYLLTLQESIRLMLGAKEVGTVSIFLTKIPNILAHLGGALAGYFILRRNWGEDYARRFALLYSLSLPLFVNATLWGQADALLSLAMLCAVAFLMADKPLHAGAAMGWALTIKLQAVVIVPVLLLYTFRKYGWQTMLRGIGLGLAVISVIALPFIFAGTAKQMFAAYTDAAGYYPFRTLNTFNLWGFLNYADQTWRHIPGEIVNKDDRLALGPLTYRHVSLLLFAGAMAVILSCVWKKPDGKTLAIASGLSVLAFFTLCTQMHERYSVPGVALLTLAAPESFFALMLWVLTSATASWNQWLVLLSNWLQYHTVPAPLKATMDTWGPAMLYLSILNIFLLAGGMFYMVRLAYPDLLEDEDETTETSDKIETPPA